VSGDQLRDLDKIMIGILFVCMGAILVIIVVLAILLVKTI
jgi:hypothetical protein